MFKMVKSAAIPCLAMLLMGAKPAAPQAAGGDRAASARWPRLTAMLRDAQTKPAENDVRGVPAISHVLSIHVGADTIQQVEKLYGRGLACIGGHDNAGRMWKDKGTGWVIYLDSIDSGAGGRVVDYVVLGDPGEVVFPTEATKGKPSKPPGVSIRSRSMSLDRALVPGMRKSEAMKVVAAKGWPCKADGDAEVIRMGGLSQPSKQVKFTDWEATLTFKKDRLVQIAVRSY